MVRCQVVKWMERKIVLRFLGFAGLLTSLLFLRPPGAIVFSCCVLTDSDTASSRWSLRGRYLSLREERYRRKTRQRAPKPPFGILLLYGGRRGDVLTPYEFAVMQLTRFRLVRRRAVSVSFLRLRQKRTLPSCNSLCGCKHCFRRTLAYCTNCGENVGTQRTTNVIQTWKSGGCGSVRDFLRSIGTSSQ